MNSLNTAEIAILDAIQEHIACPFLDAVFPVITMLGEAGIFWILTAVVLLFFKKTRFAGITMGLSLIMGLLIGNLCMKPAFAIIAGLIVGLIIGMVTEYYTSADYKSVRRSLTSPKQVLPQRSSPVWLLV